jgi:hypothetical protein
MLHVSYDLGTLTILSAGTRQGHHEQRRPGGA